MKNIFYLSLTVLLLNCGTQKIVSYKYNVVTRGYKQTITVSQDSVSVFRKTQENTTETFKTDTKLWNYLQKESKKIDLNKIGTLESPTNKRQYDAAMFGSLTITTSDSSYRSAGFDHGQPPVMLKTVVDSIVKLKSDF